MADSAVEDALSSFTQEMGQRIQGSVPGLAELGEMLGILVEMPKDRGNMLPNSFIRMKLSCLGGSPRERYVFPWVSLNFMGDRPKVKPLGKCQSLI